MAKDFAAIKNGFWALDYSELPSTAADALRAALISDIYTDSGFKYNSATIIANGEFVFEGTNDADSAAYVNQLFPAEVFSNYDESSTIRS